MAKKTSGQLNIWLVIAVLVVLVAGAYYLGAKKTPKRLHSFVTGESVEPEETQPANMLPTSSPRNPSNAVNAKCTDNGGTISTVKRGRWGEYQTCNFEDDQTCELLALYRGDCPVGGVKTIGFNTKEQVYCAELGGQTTAIPGAQCTLPNGTTCTLAQVYQDTCPSD